MFFSFSIFSLSSMKFCVDTSNVLKTTYCELLNIFTGHFCSASVRFCSGVWPPDRSRCNSYEGCICASTFGIFSPDLHAHAYLCQNSPSMKGLADTFTKTQKHSPAYPLNITSIPLFFFIADHFRLQ